MAQQPAVGGGDTCIPFPLEFFIQQTPVSDQSTNSRAREAWKAVVGQHARSRLAELTPFYLLDDRPLAVTLFYFPPAAMGGDVDNIVKLTLDGMAPIVYLDDHVVERVLVQKFEPGTARPIGALTPMLERALAAEPPVLYLRIDCDLRWRETP